MEKQEITKMLDRVKKDIAKIKERYTEEEVTASRQLTEKLSILVGEMRAFETAILVLDYYKNK